MLHQAEQNRQHVDAFVYELWREEENIKKKKKIDALCLTEEEWGRVRILLDILGHADGAQQLFLSEEGPTLHLAIPAIERLCKAWSSQREREKYKPYASALDAGIKKLDDYHAKLVLIDVVIISLCMYPSHTSFRSAYMPSTVLDPTTKMQHFKRNWTTAEQTRAISIAEKYYQEQYEKYSTDELVLQCKKPKKARHKTLIRDLSSDEETEDKASQLEWSI
jgi:hypothetical protein